MLKTCQNLCWWSEVATISIDRAQSVVEVATASEPPSEPCTISATRSPVGRVRSCSRTRNITAVSARSISTWTRRTWRCPSVATRIVSCRWRCVWWWRTACRIAWPVGISGEIISFLSLTLRFKTGSRAGEKKAEQRVRGEYLDGALAKFSRYIAADELYDGPFCVLSIVDNRTFRRLIYEVLDHDPTHVDIKRFFRRFKADLKSRNLTLQGITTDASALYPEPILEVFGVISHQLCEFHVIKDVNKGVLKAVTKVRREIAAKKPKLGRGRPSTAAARKAAKQAKRIEKKAADLFHHRHLFVQHDLTPAERRTLMRITRGHPELRVLRDIVEAMYRLFDRRCRTDTALEKLACLRRRVRRFKWIGKTLQKLFSPNLEKSLTFLDDKLLPSTSNAVERGNRRYRKMQKTVYRVRTQQQISSRVALDMEREERMPQCALTTQTLHRGRQQSVA